MQNTPEREIDLMRLLFALWRRIWVILGCAVVVAVIAGLFTYQFITPMYQASVTIYVDNSTKLEEDENYISSGSLSVAQRLVKTYVTIIKSDTVLEKVSKESDLKYSANSIRKMMSAGAVDNTEVFRIYITNADPEAAAKIANTIAEVAPGEISNFLTGSSTKIIDYAKVPSNPVSPNYERNILLGALIGAAVAIIAICIAAVMDVRIEDEEELERMFEYPVLGSIPAFENTSKGGRFSSDKNKMRSRIQKAYEYVEKEKDA